MTLPKQGVITEKFLRLLFQTKPNPSVFAPVLIYSWKIVEEINIYKNIQ